MKKAKASTINVIMGLLIIVMFGAVIYDLTFGLVTGSKSFSRIDQSIYDAFSGICTGEREEGAIYEAALFSGGPSGPVPTLLLSSNGSVYGSLKGLGEGWNPNSVSEVQLVLCIGEEGSVSKNCPGGLRIIGLLGRTVRVIEAKTGVVVYHFNIAKGYACPSPDIHHEEYSVSAIKAKLEEALSSGEIVIPSVRIFHSADIFQDPQGKYTHIQIIAHRFQNGDKLSFNIFGCTMDESKSIRGLKEYKYYPVKWVNEDTLQLLSAIDGDPIEVTNFNADCTGMLTRE